MNGFGTVVRFAVFLLGSTTRGFLTLSRNAFLIHNLKISYPRDEQSQLISGAVPKLSECFEKKIQHNKQISPEKDFEQMVKKVSKEFKISDDVGRGTVVLTRLYYNDIVEIIFDCQDDSEREAEWNSPRAQGANFEVIVTKVNGDKMVIQCVAFNPMEIKGVRYVASGKNIEDKTLYYGPDFESLDDDFREAFQSYLEDRKIDDELCDFINCYADEKAQKEYTNWLQKLSTLTS